MRKKTPFTLIELMVVICIIIILASILLPALKNAQRRAKIILCSSNLKQQMLVCSSYANDWNSCLPYNYVPGTPHPTDSYNRSKFLDLVYPEYINNGRIYYCPENYMPSLKDVSYEKTFYPATPGSSWTTYFYCAWDQYGSPQWAGPYNLINKGIAHNIISRDCYGVSRDESNHGSPACINTLYQDGRVVFCLFPKAWGRELF